jgi:RNA polymerase primary sigma factor
VNEERNQNPGKLEQYLLDIQRIVPMTQEEERRLVQQLAHDKVEWGKSVPDRQLIEEGEQAQRRLTEATLPLVVRIAKSYLGRGRAVPLMDLIDAGNGSLQRAAERFDLTKGYSYSTSATWWIRQAMMRTLTSQ